MPDVTPNTTGTSPNVRNPASQSLQSAALGVQQGGAVLGGGIQELGKSLATLNQSIIGAFQKQMDTSAKERDETVRQVSQSFEGAIEKMATASIRKSERVQGLKDQRAMIGAQGAEQERLQVASEGRAKARDLEVAQQDADMKREMARVAANVKEASKQEELFNAAKADLAAARAASFAMDVDPTQREYVAKLEADLLSNASLYDQDERLLAKGAEYLAKFGVTQAAHAAGRTGTPYPEFDLESTSGELPITQETSDLGATLVGKGGPPDPASPMRLANVRTAAHALLYDIQAGQLKTLEARRAHLKSNIEASYKTQKNVAQDTETYNKFSEQYRSRAFTVLQKVAVSAALDPDNYEELKTAQGQFNGKALKPGAIYNAYVAEMFKDSPELLTVHKKLHDGEHYILDSSTNNLGIQYRVVNDLFVAGLSTAVEDLKGNAESSKLVKGMGYSGLGYKGGLSASLAFKDSLSQDAYMAGQSLTRLDLQPYVANRKSQEAGAAIFLGLGEREKELLDPFEGPLGTIREDGKDYGPLPTTSATEVFQELMMKSGYGNRLEGIKTMLQTGKAPPKNADLLDKMSKAGIPVMPKGSFLSNAQKRQMEAVLAKTPVDQPPQPQQPPSPQPPQQPGMGLPF